MDGYRTFVHGTLQRRLIEYIRLMQLQLQGTDSSEGPGNSFVLFIMHQTSHRLCFGMELKMDR